MSLSEQRFSVLCGLLFLAIGLGGCAESTEPTGTNADLSIASSPDPATAVAMDGDEFDYVVSFEVTLTDSGGVGGELVSAAASVFESSGGIIVVSDDNPEFQINLATTTSRWEANGTVVVGFEVLYRLPGGGSEALIDVSIVVVDDAGFSFEATDRIDIS